MSNKKRHVLKMWSVRLPEELVNDVKHYCHRNNVKVQEFVATAMLDGMSAVIVRRPLSPLAAEKLLGWLEKEGVIKALAKGEDPEDTACTCEVYNVGDRCGDIAVNENCPFHGHLLGQLYKERIGE